MKKDVITMSRKELDRLPVIHRALEKRITQVKAAALINLSSRQVKRIVKKVREKGDQAIVHGNRGKPSPNKISLEKEEMIISKVNETYKDFGPTLASEKLLERDGIKISGEKLRQFMIGHNIWQPNKKRDKKIYRWRERKHHRGEMLQMDGSDHDWLEGRAPKMSLMAYIDDATSEVYARFYPFEGTFAAMDSFRRYIASHGLPFSVYFDRHSTYKTTRQPNQDEVLKGDYAKTQFARAFDELGVKPIFALSPQAKGRIERNFQTLQDRLIKEMRLENICSMDEANIFLETYLPKYNARFSRNPLKNFNLHKPPSKNINLDQIFCLKESRVIGKDYTFRWKNRIFIIREPSITLKKQRICVMESFTGNVSVLFKNKKLILAEVTKSDLQALAKVQKATQKLIRKARIYYRPPKNHPWRRWDLSKKGNLIYA